ncbi:hypothetical protein ACFWGC_26640 [Cytobacillus pseudoceanisediminis]|uniref:hypothetical protein n=1 Tax=Cytobacillus pseudoceanisediminis TaxID=3051614 RepID=UPI00365D03F7
MGYTIANYKDERHSLLAYQFTKKHSILPQNIQESLNRIFDYVSQFTNILFIQFVDAKVLKSYLQYHHEYKFTKISFQDAMKDIRHFKFYLINLYGVELNLEVDFSIHNFNLWLRV